MGFELFVGDLNQEVDEIRLYETFRSCGVINKIQVIRDHGTGISRGFAFITFARQYDAWYAMDYWNCKELLGQKMRITWSEQDLEKLNKETKDNNIYMKNITPDVTDNELYSFLGGFGQIRSFKVVRKEPSSLGFCFIQFEDEKDAKKCIERLDGKILESVMNRSRNFIGPPNIGTPLVVGKFIPRDKRAIDNQLPNIYVKHFGNDMDEEKLKKLFQAHGTVMSVAIQSTENDESKRFGFVAMSSLDEAKSAIKALHETCYNENEEQRLYCAFAQKKNYREMYLKDEFKKHKNELVEKTKHRNLYVKPLRLDVDEKQLRETFSQFGTITSVKVMRSDGVSRGFGFICFSTTEEASNAIQEMNGKMLFGQPINVCYAQPRAERRRMLRALRVQQKAPAPHSCQPQMAPPQWAVPPVVVPPQWVFMGHEQPNIQQEAPPQNVEIPAPQWVPAAPFVEGQQQNMQQEPLPQNIEVPAPEPQFIQQPLQPIEAVVPEQQFPEQDDIYQDPAVQHVKKGPSPVVGQQPYLLQQPPQSMGPQIWQYLPHPMGPHPAFYKPNQAPPFHHLPHVVPPPPQLDDFQLYEAERRGRAVPVDELDRRIDDMINLFVGSRHVSHPVYEHAPYTCAVQQRNFTQPGAAHYSGAQRNQNQSGMGMRAQQNNRGNRGGNNRGSRRRNSTRNQNQGQQQRVNNGIDQNVPSCRGGISRGNLHNQRNRRNSNSRSQANRRQNQANVQPEQQPPIPEEPRVPTPTDFPALGAENTNETAQQEAEVQNPQITFGIDTEEYKEIVNTKVEPPVSSGSEEQASTSATREVEPVTHSAPEATEPVETLENSASEERNNVAAKTVEQATISAPEVNESTPQVEALKQEAVDSAPLTFYGTPVEELFNNQSGISMSDWRKGRTIVPLIHSGSDYDLFAGGTSNYTGTRKKSISFGNFEIKEMKSVLESTKKVPQQQKSSNQEKIAQDEKPCTSKSTSVEPSHKPSTSGILSKTASPKAVTKTVSFGNMYKPVPSKTVSKATSSGVSTKTTSATNASKAASSKAADIPSTSGAVTTSDSSKTPSKSAPSKAVTKSAPCKVVTKSAPSKVVTKSAPSKVVTKTAPSKSASSKAADKPSTSGVVTTPASFKTPSKSAPSKAVTAAATSKAVTKASTSGGASKSAPSEAVTKAAPSKSAQSKAVTKASTSGSETKPSTSGVATKSAQSKAVTKTTESQAAPTPAPRLSYASMAAKGVPKRK